MLAVWEAKAKHRFRVSAGAHRKSPVCQLEVFVSVLQGDNLRTKALDNMMGGALEGRKEDVLHMVGHIIPMNFFFFYKTIFFPGFHSQS